jgi:hypothetical protein
MNYRKYVYSSMLFKITNEDSISRYTNNIINDMGERMRAITQIG